MIWSGDVVKRSVILCDVEELLRSGRGGGVGLMSRDSEKGKDAKSDESPRPGDSSTGSA